MQRDNSWEMTLQLAENQHEIKMSNVLDDIMAISNDWNALANKAMFQSYKIYNFPQ